jgi:hypothetical protein
MEMLKKVHHIPNGMKGSTTTTTTTTATATAAAAAATATTAAIITQV